MTALASLLYQDRFQQLEMLFISYNHGIRDEGIIALAHAIEARKLPKLKLFEAKAGQGYVWGSAPLARCVVNGCPKLQKNDLMHIGVKTLLSEWVIICNLIAAGQDRKVKVNVSAQT